MALFEAVALAAECLSLKDVHTFQTIRTGDKRRSSFRMQGARLNPSENRRKGNAEQGAFAPPTGDAR